MKLNGNLTKKIKTGINTCPICNTVFKDLSNLIALEETGMCLGCDHVLYEDQEIERGMNE